MYSFYGGKPGNSFIIVQTYKTVAEMITNFKKGSDYTTVHYDEYVLINTVNKSDPDNGKIYRRGYNFTDEKTGGAEYIGCIAGPAGAAPLLKMTTIPQIDSKASEEGQESSKTSGEYSIADGTLVPGKTSQNLYNDSIKWACYSVANENNEESIAYIGFTIPYPVLDFEVEAIDSNREAFAQRIDTKEHPFYEKWKINIPKGATGNSLKNFRVITADASVQDYTGKVDDIDNERKILVYDYYEAGKDPVTMYLGDYNMISNITNENGNIIINYTHNNSQSFPVKFINSVSLNSETGEFTVTYNNGDPYIASLTMVKDVHFNNSTGAVTIDYTNQQSEEKAIIKWINGISLDAATGKLNVTWNTSETTQAGTIQWINTITQNSNGNIVITWNNGNETIFPIRQITRVDVSNTGTMTFSYNTGDSTSIDSLVKWINDVRLNNNGIIEYQYNTSSGWQSFGNPLYWINEVTLANDGTLTFVWNNNNRQSVSFEKTIKWIDNVRINENNQRLSLKYNNNNNYTDIGDPINYVTEMAIDNNRRLLVRYSDPARRNASDSITYNGKTGWTNIGTVNFPDIISANNQVYNFEWVGAGMVVDDLSINSQYKVLKFTLPTNKLLSNNIQGGTIHGLLRAVVIRNDGGGSWEQEVFPGAGDSYDLYNLGVNQINQCLTGITVSIITEIPIGSNSQIFMANIIITEGMIVFNT